MWSISLLMGSAARGFARTNSNVVHLFLFSPFIEQLLKGDGVGHLIEGGLQVSPRIPQLRGTLRVSQRRRIEHLPVHATQHVSERNIGGSAREQITPLFA